MSINSINSYQKNVASLSYNIIKSSKENKTAKREEIDTLEISAAAYELQASEKMSATSGEDTLGITKGSKENSFVIHFSDSAMVSRAISRGYITVNGTDIQLTDDEKNQLQKADQQAQAKREQGFNQYIMEHDLAVAKQQGDAISGAYDEMLEAFKIAMKISSGKKVTNEEVQKLIKVSPDLYSMAMEVRSLAKHQDDDDDSEPVKKEKDDTKQSTEGVSWSDFEWKSAETQMTVDMGGDAPFVGNIAAEEITITP